MHDQKKSYVLGLAAVLLWSTVASAFKISLRYLDYAQLLLLASCASTLTLGVLVIAQGKWRLLRQSRRSDLIRSLGLGLLNPLCYYLVLFKAYERLPAQEAQALNYTWALTLTLLSIPLLGQRVYRRDIIAGLVCYAGVLVIATHGAVWTLHFSDALGVALALGSTVLWALYWIFNTRDKRDPLVRLLLNFAFSLPFSLGYCLLISEWQVPTWSGWLGAGYIGLFEMGITYVLWQLALQYAQHTARVSNLIFISPFCSLVLIHFALGEAILWSTLVGLMLIVAGLLYQQFASRVHSTGP